MLRLVLFVLFIAALWYGWNNHGKLFNRQPGHEAVIENHSGRDMARVRLSVDGQTFVRETIADDAKAVLPFRVNADASFRLVWEWTDTPGEQQWSGGMVPKGPMLQRHLMVVDGDGDVLYRAENR